MRRASTRVSDSPSSSVCDQTIAKPQRRSTSACWKQASYRRRLKNTGERRQRRKCRRRGPSRSCQDISCFCRDTGPLRAYQRAFCPATDCGSENDSDSGCSRASFGSGASRRASHALRRRSQYRRCRPRGPERFCPGRTSPGPDSRLLSCHPHGVDHFGGRNRCPRRRAP